MSARHKVRDIGYDVPKVHGWFNAALLAVFLAAANLSNLKNRDFFLTIDGTDRPFYGKSYHNKKRPQPKEHELTIAGKFTDPAFRQKGDRGVPQYPGTTRKHSYLQVNAHLYDSGESFPIGIQRGRATKRAVELLVDALNQLPFLPAFILADKEFCNLPKAAALRKWCDKRQVVLLIASPKDSRVRRITKHAWYNGLFKPTVGSDEPLYVHSEQRLWRDAPRDDHPYTLMTIYCHENPRANYDEETPEIHELPNNIYAVCFMTNVAVTPENAFFLYSHYRLRWGCENLHKRWKAYCGRSFSHGMYRRDYAYQMSMVMMATCSLWRLERRLTLGLPVNHRDLSHSRYFGALAVDCLDRLRAATRRAPGCCGR